MSLPSRFQWDEIQALSFPETNIIALTNVGAIIVYACSNFYNDRRLWFDGENEVTDGQWDDVSKAIGLLEYELMKPLVGAILPHVMGSISGLNMLPCDGAVYLRADYPLLYDAIDPAYILDAVSFFVPNLQDRFPLGAGSIFPVNDMGGERNHLLTVDEMPLHSHTNDPHAHTEITALPSLADFGTGAPVPSATPSASLTSFESISIHNTGGNEPHNNMPPYLAVKWAIVAG